MQNYMLERLLERISVSNYNENFILKGGFLIAAMVGLDSRATMDMDATLKGMAVDEQSIMDMFEALCNIDLNDNVQSSFCYINEIRETDEYTGYRVALLANYPPMSVPLKLDITTGDKITPREIKFKYHLLIEDREIAIFAYNLETVLAEKIETVISRGDLSTRPRDYYDIFVLFKLQSANIKYEQLKDALKATALKRGSMGVIGQYEKIMEIVENSAVMQKRWKTYQKDFDYAANIEFRDCAMAVLELMEYIK